MQKFEFHGQEPYVEYFWNHIPGKKELGKIYTHVITSTDAFEWDYLHPGDTLHMMAQESGFEKLDYWVVTSAISDCIDDTELNNKVASLVAAGARYVDMEADWGHAIAIRTYDELVKSSGIIDPHTFSKDDELHRIDQVYYHRKYMRELNSNFVANARVFSDDELSIIAEHKRAEAAFYELFKRVD